jgi:hypothetical protein
LKEADMAYSNLAAADPTAMEPTGRNAGTRDEQLDGRLRALLAIHGGIATNDIDEDGFDACDSIDPWPDDQGFRKGGREPRRRRNAAADGAGVEHG